MSDSFGSSRSWLVWLSLYLPYYCFTESTPYFIQFLVLSKFCSHFIIFYLLLVIWFDLLILSFLLKNYSIGLGMFCFYFHSFLEAFSFISFLIFFPFSSFNSVPLGLHEFLCVLQFFLLLISSFVPMWKVEYKTLFR